MWRADAEGGRGGLRAARGGGKMAEYISQTIKDSKKKIILISQLIKK